MVPLRLIILKSSSNLQCVSEAKVAKGCYPRHSPYAIVDYVYPLTIREFKHALDGVLFLVEDDVVGAVGLCKRCLLWGGGSANDCSTTSFGHLSVQQPNTAGNCVDKDRVSLIHVIRLGHLYECREALNERGCGDTSGNLVWYSIDSRVPVDRNILL